ncbi:hypothetical protein H0H87_003856 [Tephrocybe sp. NHM501043]|nr:hypothetical protein H0H87_003856 [Tephrocybe sp. NHM501043]
MHPITPKKQAPPPLRFNTLSLKRFSKPKLEPLESSGSWPTPPPPLRVPSPTATETSGMLEDLLTPQLGTRVASSEYSSSASLRDHVDYSRPISGNRPSEIEYIAR